MTEAKPSGANENVSGAPQMLVVEDEPALSEGIKKHFEGLGFSVTVASDGMFASGIIRTKPFAVILSDIKLPGMGGLQLVVAIRSSPINKNTPVFLMTGHADAEVVQRAAQLNIAKLIIKPFELDDLSKILAKQVAIKKPKTYDVRVINCFVQAADEVLSYYFKKPVTLGKTKVKGEPEAMGYTSGLIGFSGPGLTGSLSISFDRPFIAALAQAVFQGASPQMDDTMIADLAGEMANQLCGKVKINFSKIGLKMNIGLPKVVLGDGHKIVHKSDRPVLMIPVNCEQLSCVLEFAMTDVEDGQIIEEQEPEGGAAGGDVMLF